MCHQRGFMPWHCCQIFSSTSCAFWACLPVSSGASGLVSSTCLSVFFLFFYFVTVKPKKLDLLSHLVSNFMSSKMWLLQLKMGKSLKSNSKRSSQHLRSSLLHVPTSLCLHWTESNASPQPQIANCAFKACFNVCLGTFGFGFLQQSLLCWLHYCKTFVSVELSVSELYSHLSIKLAKKWNQSTSNK